MRHLKVGRKFNRSSSHRKSMLHNLASSILLHKQVKTTLAKAKDVRRIVERIISWSKHDTIHHRRLIFRTIRNNILINDIVNSTKNNYLNRNGGYLQIIKLGFRRGDNAEMAIVRLVHG